MTVCSRQGVILIHGGRIGFFQGDIKLLMDDLKTLRPTVFPVVPRLLNRMFDRVGSLGGRTRGRYKTTAVKLLTRFNVDIFPLRPNSHQVFSQANTPLKKWLLDFAFSRKEAELKTGLVRQDSIWDKLIFKKVQVGFYTNDN